MGLLLVLMGKRSSLSIGPAKPFLVVCGMPVLRMEVREESKADMLERELPASQSKNTVPKLLPGFSVTK